MFFVENKKNFSGINLMTNLKKYCIIKLLKISNKYYFLNYIQIMPIYKIFFILKRNKNVFCEKM